MGNIVVGYVFRITGTAVYGNGAFTHCAAAGRMRAESRVVGEVPFERIYTPVAHGADDYIFDVPFQIAAKVAC